jgi:predicted ATPase
LENNLNDDRPTDTYPINEALSLETTAPHQVLLDRLARGVMVGREAELNELKRRWDLARLGQPLGEPLVLISGEAGIGKTRLLQEFKVYANLRDGYVLHGAARQQDAGTPYAIFANALRDYVREQPADLLRRHTPGFIAGEVVKLAPQLADKIGYIPPNPTLEPEAERARLLEQVSDFFLYMAGEHPILLLLDDLHFADPGSLDLLETLIRRSTGGSLLVTGAYQDVALTYSNPINHLTAALNSANLAHTIPLRRLARPGVEQMLLALLGNSVSEEFVDSIYRATEGNPLFVEEVVKGLAVDGQIRLKDGLWQRRDSGRLNLPGSLKSVLGGRLERIEKSTLELLQLAAVIGRSFSPELLVRAGSYDDEASTQAAIEEALGYQLIEIRNISDQPADSADKRGLNLEYQFQHGLIAEALYEELRPLRRRRLHRNVAKAMASLQTQPTPAVLAYHFIAAAQEDQAVPYLRQAGQAASQVYANTEAVDHLSQAREILEDLALDLRGKALQQNLVERFELLSEERAVLNLMSQPNRELAALQELQRLVDALQDKSREVAVMSRLAAYYWQVGKLNQAEETARQALQMAHNNKDRQGELYGLEQLARIFWTRRDGESMHFASKALEIAQELADRHREGRLTELIGSIYTDTLHDVKQAAYYFAQALAICRETNNRYEEAWTLWGMGGLALLIDDYTDALERYAEAKQISEAIGSTLQVGWDLYYMGDVWYSLGDYEQALSAYQQAQTIFSSAHHQRGGIYSLISLGLVALAQDALEKAEGYLEQAKQQAEDRNDLILMLRSYEGWVAFYQTLQEEDAYVAAIRLSNRIIKLAHEGGHFEHELLGYYLRGLGFYALADFDQAYDSSATAVTYLDHLTYLHSPQVTVAEIYFQHYRILTALKQTSEAQSFLQKAYSETMRKANLIIDDQQYDDYLNQVGLNRAIVAAATR